MSPKNAHKPAPMDELDLVMEYMQADDDVSKFVGLSLLRSTLCSKNDPMKAHQDFLRCRYSIPTAFLKRLLSAADYKGERIIDRDYMIALAVWVTLCLALIVPFHIPKDQNLPEWTIRLLNASKIGPADTRGRILQILSEFAKSKHGLYCLLMADGWSLLPKLTLKKKDAFYVLVHACDFAKQIAGMSVALPKLCDAIFNLAKTCLYHEAFLPETLECLNDLVDYFPGVCHRMVGPKENQGTYFLQDSSPPTWLMHVALLLLKSAAVAHHSDDQSRLIHANVLLSASLLRIWLNDAALLLFRTVWSWLFVRLRLADLQKWIPSLVKTKEPDYPRIAERLFYSYNIICAFLSLPWRKKKPEQDNNSERASYAPDLVRQLEQDLDHVSSLTMLYLIKRYDAAAKHMAIEFGDPIAVEERRIAPISQMEWDRLTTAQLCMVSLWSREGLVDFGPKVQSLLHVTLGLYNQRNEMRRPILMITQFITAKKEGVELFNHIDGWGMLVDDLEAIVQLDELDVLTEECGLHLVDILFNVASCELEHGSTEEHWKDVAKLAGHMDSERLCGALEIKCAVAVLAADIYQMAVRHGATRSAATLRIILRQTRKLLTARERIDEQWVEQLEETRIKLRYMCQQAPATMMPQLPFLFHIIVEVPASIAFFLHPSMTLSQRQGHAHAVIRQYALLLMASNLIAYAFSFFSNLQFLPILTTMIARALRAPRALPTIRHKATTPSARRSVTTDAASSHAEKGQVPAEDDKPFEVRLSDESFETYQLDPPPYTLNTTKKELKKMYYDMVSIRRMEMAADRLYKEKKIRGFCHLSTGQEAVAAGIENAITKEDHVITAYRCHGFALMRGGTVKSIIGELLGRREGIAYGKGGSMHMFSKGFYGGNGIVGAQVPVGAGIAFANQYNGKANTTICLYGDGASNQGQVFEAFNMAKLWGLPILFGCENNKYGMGTAANRAAALTEYYKRGQYIPGLKVNGMDILAVKAAVEYGKQYTVAGHGPLVLEYVTYRYGGHSMSDPGTTYRTREEIQRMRSTNDPIAGLKQKLLDWEVTTEEELKGLDKDARAYVDAGVKEAEAMKEPEPTWRNLYEDIYVRGSEPEFLRGRIPEENFYYGDVDMGTEGKRFEQERKQA
ncbi:MAG: hypothetical protein Q9206_004110 [Seirophora lacunosa]